MTEDELNIALSVRDQFLTETREIYRKLVKPLDDKIETAARYMIQDELSLFSPWFNADE